MVDQENPWTPLAGKKIGTSNVGLLNLYQSRGLTR